MELRDGDGISSRCPQSPEVALVDFWGLRLRGCRSNGLDWSVLNCDKPIVVQNLSEQAWKLNRDFI